MRFLKTLTLNRRAIYDDRLAINTSSEILMNTTKNLLVPKGPMSERPSSPVNGMLRYNTELNEIPGYPGTYYGGMEVYQGSSWRELRYKEPTALKVQYMGVGDDYETTFGPLSPDPFYEYSTIESLTTWDAEQMAQNLLVINEGYWQFAGYDSVSYTHLTLPTIYSV